MNTKLIVQLTKVRELNKFLCKYNVFSVNLLNESRIWNGDGPVIVPKKVDLNIINAMENELYTLCPNKSKAAGEDLRAANHKYAGKNLQTTSNKLNYYLKNYVKNADAKEKFHSVFGPMAKQEPTIINFVENIDNDDNHHLSKEEIEKCEVIKNMFKIYEDNINANFALMNLYKIVEAEGEQRACVSVDYKYIIDIKGPVFGSGSDSDPTLAPTPKPSRLRVSGTIDELIDGLQKQKVEAISTDIYFY